MEYPRPTFQQLVRNVENPSLHRQNFIQFHFQSKRDMPHKTFNGLNIPDIPAIKFLRKFLDKKQPFNRYIKQFRKGHAALTMIAPYPTRHTIMDQPQDTLT